MMGHILMTIAEIFQTVFFVVLNLAFVYYFRSFFDNPNFYKK